MTEKGWSEEHARRKRVLAFEALFVLLFKNAHLHRGRHYVPWFRALDTFYPQVKPIDRFPPKEVSL